MKQPIFRTLAACAALLIITLPLIGVRAAGGQIEGKISDPKGAAIPGATIRVTDTETSRSATAVTDAQGRYTLASLSPGSYELRAELSGFRPLQRTGITLTLVAIVSGIAWRDTRARMALAFGVGAVLAVADGMRGAGGADASGESNVRGEP